MTIVLFLGRFQPFHKGHLLALKKMHSKNETVLIGIGSSNKSNTFKNPFTFEERKQMIQAVLETEQLHCDIYPIPDTETHNLWIQQLLDTLPKFDKIYTNNPVTQDCFASAGILSQEIVLFEPYSATLVRENIAAGKPWEELIPIPVKDYLIKINAVSRIRSLVQG